LDNYINGRPCLWIAADSPLAIKFNTQCLGQSLIENGPLPPGMRPGDKDYVTDVCHPVDMSEESQENAAHEHEERVAVAMNGAKNKSMTGYAPKFQLMVALIAVATVWVLCCISMYYRIRNANGKKVNNKDDTDALLREGRATFESTYGTTSDPITEAPIVFV